MRQGVLQPPQSHWIIQTESFCGPTEARIVLKRLNPLIRPGQGALFVITAETPDGKKQDLFIVDYHFHIWNAAKENWLRPDLAKGWINCFYDYTKALSPKEYVWDWDTYAYYGEEKALKDVFGDGHVDMAIFEPQTLMYFYHKGFSNVDAISGYVKKWPDRLVMGSRWDPRDGEAGKGLLDEQVRKFRSRPLQLRNTKPHAARWQGARGAMWRRWRCDCHGEFQSLTY